MIPVSVKKTFLLREPLHCSPAPESAILPLIRCSDSSSSQIYYSPEECFFTDTGSMGRFARDILLFVSFAQSQHFSNVTTPALEGGRISRKTRVLRLGQQKRRGLNDILTYTGRGKGHARIIYIYIYICVMYNYMLYIYIYVYVIYIYIM